MEGLEVSIITIKKLDNVKFRFDSEYYQKKHLLLQNIIDSIDSRTISQLAIKLDCSAFYPSITEHYNFNREGIPFIRVDEIHNGLVRIGDKTAFLPMNILNQNNSTIAKAFSGDIVIAKGGNTLGKVGLLTDEYSMYSVCRDVLLLKTSNLDESTRYYIWSVLNSKYGYELLIRTASQTGQPHLTLASVSEIAVPKYTTCLENIFGKIFINAQNLQWESLKLYNHAEQLLLEELGLKNWQPSSENINIKSYQESFLSTGRIDAEHYQPKYDEIENIILSKEYFILKDLFDIKSSSSPTKYIDEGIAVIKTKNVRIPSVSYDNISDYAETTDLLIQKEDLLFASMGVGSLGRISYINDVLKPATIDGTIRLFRIRDSYKHKAHEIPTMLFLTSRIGQELIYKFIIGSTGIISISKDSIENLVVPILKDNIRQKLSCLVLKSISLKQQSENLLEVAKRAVEIAIEEDEATAIGYVSQNTLI